MKLILLLAVCIFAVNAVLVEGNVKIIIDDYVTVNLFTRRNPNTPQQLDANQASINRSNLNHTARAVLIISDWKTNYNGRLCTGLVHAYLQLANFNVMCVDYGLAFAPLQTAINGIPSIAQRIATRIDFINTHGGIGFLQVVGHGLGAHIAGSLGHQVQSGQLGKIVGLDPLRATISYNDVNQRLSPDDAVYVESIQTNGGEIGWDPPIGRANFYPNGGRHQPGCGLDIGGLCSHERAIEYMIESVSFNNFKTRRCQSYQQAEANQCDAAFSNVRLNGPRNFQRKVSGIFYVPVNAQSLFGTAQVQNTSG